MITEQKDKDLYYSETKMTRVLKIGVEPEKFRAK